MSPAGYWPQLHAAIEAGADSVYFGLHHFTARAKVGFGTDELPEVFRTLHKRGVKGYVTFNTLVFEHELEAAARALTAIAEAGADAIIVQDYGIVRMARALVPDLELHASTQMSITDAAGVRLAQSRGIARVTLARELSLAEIRQIAEATSCELEIFVHGALCVAYSGQCFSSEAWGGRSANRGQCAQACRLPYEMIVDGEPAPLGDARYLLSPGDLYALRQVPEVLDAGVAALKIEGRYKDADYVALTTAAYRKAVDEAWEGRMLSVTPAEELRLEQVYSRSRGPYFLKGTNHQEVVGGRSPRHQGVLIGRVVSVAGGRVKMEPSGAQAIAPLKAGDGVVFDSASWRSPQEQEEGGRVYQVLPALDGSLDLAFATGAIRWSRIRAGDPVFRTHDPELDAFVKPLLSPGAPLARQLLAVTVSAAPGSRLQSRWFLVRDPDVSVTVASPEALAEARNSGLSREMLEDQFGRLGQTPYELASLSLELNGNPFVPVSLLNQMRREAVELLQELQAAAPRRAIHAVPPRPAPARAENPGKPFLHLLVRAPNQLDAALAARPASVTLDYLDLFGLRPSVDRVKAAGLEVRVATPRIFKPGEERILRFLLSLDCPLLVRSAGVADVLRGQPAPRLTGDFSLNTANSYAAELYMEMGLERLTPGHDLNAAQIAALAAHVRPDRLEVVAYQHLPVFHTEHCVFCRFLSEGTTYKDCGRPCEKHLVALRDDAGRAHPVLADIGCRNTVFGAEAQESSRWLSEWLDAGIRHFRLEFVHETPVQVAAITEAFGEALAGRLNATGLRRALASAVPAGTTEGSLYVPKDYQLLPILQ